MAEANKVEPTQIGSSNTPVESTEKPISIIIMGMAGSGKTTLVASLCDYLKNRDKNPYVINIDPAVYETPYEANLDIRDTVNYKEVMKQYKLGPNGAIVTSLNLFATKFDQVLDLLSQRSLSHKYFLFDTPGQIEVFTWSASGTIISETLAMTFPSVIIYVVDTPRSANPITFMSTILCACSVFAKYNMPFILAFSKTDVVGSSQVENWLRDFSSFAEALQQEDCYMSTMTYSLSLSFEECYQDLKAVGVSAVTGEGMEELVKAIDESRIEYENIYKPLYEQARDERASAMLKDEIENLEKLNLGGTLGNLNITEKNMFDQCYLSFPFQGEDKDDDDDS